jgi:hypothetical protein
MNLTNTQLAALETLRKTNNKGAYYGELNSTRAGSLRWTIRNWAGGVILHVPASRIKPMIESGLLEERSVAGQCRIYAAV